MKRPIWEGIYPHLDEVPAKGPGFSGSRWLEQSLQQAREKRDRYDAAPKRNPGGWSGESPLAAAAAMVSRGTGRLAVLDFGGGIGNGFFSVAYSLAPSVNLDYTVVETPAVCDVGESFFGGDKRIRFLPDLAAAGKADLVHIGSALQYIGPWEAVLDQLCSLAESTMVFSDLMAGEVPTFATVQHYYDSDIPFWFFNIDAITDRLYRAGFHLVFKNRFESRILGVRQSLPQDNFPMSHRLGHACNLIWMRGRG